MSVNGIGTEDERIIENIGENLLMILEQREISSEDLENKLVKEYKSSVLSKDVIHKWTHQNYKKDIGILKIIKIAKVLNISIDSLVYGVSTKNIKNERLKKSPDVTTLAEELLKDNELKKITLSLLKYNECVNVNSKLLEINKKKNTLFPINELTQMEILYHLICNSNDNFIAFLQNNIHEAVYKLAELDKKIALDEGNARLKEQKSKVILDVKSTINSRVNTIIEELIKTLQDKSQK